MPRRHTSSSKPTIQSLRSISWRNNYWTSHWKFTSSKFLTHLGLEIEIPSPTSWYLISRGKSRFANELHISKSVIISPARNYSLNKKSRKKVHFAGRNRRLAVRKLVRPRILVPGNWMRTLSVFLLTHCTTRKEPYLRRKRSGKLFLPIHRTKEDLPFNSELEIGHKIGAPLWPIRTTNWCSSSLGHDKAEIAVSVRGQRSTIFLGKRWPSTHPWRK